jgi:hypothetical protein
MILIIFLFDALEKRRERERCYQPGHLHLRHNLPIIHVDMTVCFTFELRVACMGRVHRIHATLFVCLVVSNPLGLEEMSCLVPYLSTYCVN